MIEVYDDIMPRSYNKLLNEIVTHMSFEWHYLHDVTYETLGKEEQYRDKKLGRFVMTQFLDLAPKTSL